MKNVSEGSGIILGKILVVEPDLALATKIKASIESQSNYLTELVPDSDEALARIRSEKYHLVLADHHLGTRSGFEFAFEIRKDQITRPEIILISNDPMISVFEAHQLGISTILKKPVNVDELMFVVQKVASEQRKFERVTITENPHTKVLGNIQNNTQGAPTLDVLISNIGRGGFFCKFEKIDELPKIGQIINFKIKLGMVPDHTFSGTGIIRWTKETSEEIGAGVEFLVIPEDSEHLISAFVDLFKVRPFVPGATEG